MFANNRNCIFSAQFDPAADKWNAIQVFRDGNVIELARGFASEEIAEAHARTWLDAYNEWSAARAAEALNALRSQREDD